MSENANEAGSLSTRSEKQASDGLSIVAATTDTIQKVADGMADATTTMEELAQKVNSITGIVKAIREIADQTNLLALNAAIERPALASKDGASPWSPMKSASWLNSHQIDTRDFEYRRGNQADNR